MEQHNQMYDPGEDASFGQTSFKERPFRQRGKFKYTVGIVMLFIVEIVRLNAHARGRTHTH